MKKKFAFVSLAFLFITETTFAGSPTYLSCDFSENRTFKITLNEDIGKATIDYGTGKIANYPAQFNADTVKFSDSLGDIASSTFTINRTTLDISRTIPAIHSSDPGKCHLVNIPKNRKF